LMADGLLLERHPSGAKAPWPTGLTARLKRCPFKARERAGERRMIPIERIED
jgi:hypothetical protein